MELNTLIAECTAYDFKVMLEEKKPKSWLKKAAASKPDNAVIWTYLGICYNQQGANADDPTKRKEFFQNAVEVFDKAKQYDPNRQISNWGYPRYQAYYALYGENDPKTQAAEADK